MSSTRGLMTPLIAAAGIVGVGYGVATFGQTKSVGNNIPVNKSILRTQGAQGEARRAGASDEEVSKIDKVPTKGGDKGLKVVDRDG